jgi:16S rRNA pseudouridine516 synthase
VTAKLKRLDQVLANYGYSSRSEAKAFIREGVVSVDGAVVRDPARRVDPRSVLIDGEPVDHPDGVFVLLNKPAGYACSHADGESPLAYSLLPERWLRRNPAVNTVGRLDRDTSGLIIVTDHTDLVHRLSSPKSGIEKVYEVTVDRPLDADLAEVFASGTLTLEGETSPCLPAKFEMTGETTCRLILKEGRNRQVRRMFESRGWTVVALKRTRFGPWELGDLPEGEWREAQIGDWC